MNSLYRHWLCLRSILPILNLCRFSVVSVLIGAAALILVDQAQEALRALAEQDGLKLLGPCALLFFGVFVWSFFSAYCARVILYIDFPDAARDGPCTARWREEVPRVLGVAATLSVALAICISAGDATSGKTSWTLYGLALLCAIGTIPFYAFLKYRLGLITRISVISHQYFARFSGKPAETPTPGSTPPPTPAPELKVSYAPIARNFRDLPKDTIAWFGSFFAITIVCFVIFTYWPLPSGRFFGAATILLLALAAWIPFGTLLVYINERYRTPPLMTLVLACAIVFSYFFDHHAVRTLADEKQATRVTVTEQATQWLNVRQEQIKKSGGRYPVFFVAAEGGGIRAAYWTASVLSMLEDQLGNAQKDGRFSDHVFAISGVSGGSLGGALFTALVAERQRGQLKTCTRPDGEPVTHSPTQNCAHNALDEDFLGPTIATMLYPDLAYHFMPAIELIAPQQYSDRAVTLERGWETKWHEAIGGADLMSASFDRLWAEGRRFTVPSLFLNGTNVETGKRMIMSNLEINPAKASDAPLLYSDAYDVQQLIGKPVRLSTAVHMSARFTYVSPAGTITSPHFINTSAAANPDHGKAVPGHIVDGGYFENSGAATVQEVLREFNRVARIRHPKGEIVPILIILSNNPEREFINCKVVDNKFKPKRWATEVLSPLDALLKAREARGTFAEEAIIPQLGDENQCARFALKKIDHPLPLGWTLSSDTERNIDGQWSAFFKTDVANNPFARVCAQMGGSMAPLSSWNPDKPRCVRP